MLRVLDHLEEWLIAFLIGAATLLIFTAVVHRYSLDFTAARGWDAAYDWLFAINLTWAQELCIYMFVWMAKFGAAYGVRTGIHVGVDVLINQLAQGLRAKVVLLGLFCGALFTGVVGTLGAAFVWEIAQTESTSPDLEVPVWIVYLAVPLGSYLMCFRFLQVAWSFWRTGTLPEREHARVEGLEREVERAEANGRPGRVMIGEAVQLAEERAHIPGRATGGEEPPEASGPGGVGGR